MNEKKENSNEQSSGKSCLCWSCVREKHYIEIAREGLEEADKVFTLQGEKPLNERDFIDCLGLAKSLLCDGVRSDSMDLIAAGTLLVGKTLRRLELALQAGETVPTARPAHDESLQEMFECQCSGCIKLRTALSSGTYSSVRADASSGDSASHTWTPKAYFSMIERLMLLAIRDNDSELAGSAVYYLRQLYKKSFGEFPAMPMSAAMRTPPPAPSPSPSQN